MADRRHAEVCEVLGRQLGEACLIDRVFPECLLVAFQAEAAQPGRDIHGFTRTVGRTHPLVTTAGTSANEKLSLPQPAWMHTFFGREALVPESQTGRGPNDPHALLAPDGVIR